MSAVVTVHLLRHGEVHNPDRVLYGRLPGYRLSALGERQAAHAATWLAARGDIGYLVASPLERAQQTAAPLAAATGLEIATDDRLIEAGNELEGRQVAGGKGLLSDPSNWKYFRNPLRPSWGEPYEQIAERVLAAAHAARDRAAKAGGAAVCVSHQLPIVTARRRVEGQHLFHDPRKRQCALASVTSLTFDGDTVVRVDYAEPAADLPAGEGLGA
ncbi:histidine phosphatase family protein [uncultured Jatrophihabitans sp.]|uniref:histidine phosphatase family protein n=1 Tax=uncultured Jatrophihabitans sp. TaxID=1610747 RepID=UPI0035C962AE